MTKITPIKKFLTLWLPSLIILASLFALELTHQRFLLNFGGHHSWQRPQFSEYLLHGDGASTVYFIFFANIISVFMIARHVKKRIISKRHSSVEELYMLLLAVRYDGIKSQYNTCSAVFEKMKLNKKCKYFSLLGALKDLMYFMLTKGENGFLRSILSVIPNPEYSAGEFREIKKNLQEIINYAEDIMVYPELSAKDAQVVKDLELAVENNNVALGASSLKQLSNSLQEKEERLHRQDRDSRNAKVWVTVGIILTVFFGILSFVQAIM